MTHIRSEPACDGVLEEGEAAIVSNKLAVLVAQHWVLRVRSGLAIPGEAQCRLPDFVHVERVKPLVVADSTMPVVVLQTLKFSVILGVSHSKNDDRNLTALAQKFNCPALCLRAKDRSWQTLEKAFTGHVHQNIFWVVAPASSRDTLKKKRFNEISRTTSLELKELRCKMGTPYHPANAETRLHYLQDVHSEMRQQGWPKITRRLILKANRERAWWNQWFTSNHEPVQVPIFWLWFWVVKHSLHTVNRRIDVDVLAREVGSLYSSESSYFSANEDLVAELKEPLTEMLERLCALNYLVRDKGEYRCIRTARE